MIVVEVKRRRRESVWHMDTPRCKKAAKISGPSNGDCDTGEQELQNHVPADYPSHQLAHGGVCVRVCTSGAGAQCREFRIAKPGTQAPEPGDQI